MYGGPEGLIRLATLPAADIVLIAIVGTAGLKPALAAIHAGKDIAVASKEILVMAGETVVAEAKKHGVRVLTVDSEHSAIFQCLNGERAQEIDKIFLTASGGAFRDKTPEELTNVTPEEALAHPTWNMGKKVTIDSATLMNKGLEIIDTFTNTNGMYDVKIFDKYGKLLVQDKKSGPTFTVSVAGLPTGVYIVAVTDRENKYTGSLSVVH